MGTRHIQPQQHSDSSQNVVSHGKKFTVSGTPHYNPFNNQTIGDNASHGKNTVGWTTYDFTLDTTTSLGLDGFG